MGLLIENREQEVEIGIPLSHDLEGLIMHFRQLADKLEKVKNQDFVDGKMKALNSENIESISMKITSNGYRFLDITITKNWNCSLSDMKKAEIL